MVQVIATQRLVQVLASPSHPPALDDSSNTMSRPKVTPVVKTLQATTSASPMHHPLNAFHLLHLRSPSGVTGCFFDFEGL